MVWLYQGDGHKTGYANNWNIKNLRDYISSKYSKVLLERDHGGPLQTEDRDDGYDSFKADVSNVSIVHIDVWKVCSSITEAVEKTVKYMAFCLSHNPKMKFEIGTESGIFPYTVQEFNNYLSGLKKQDNYLFESIVYAVVQSGTLVKADYNEGVYDPVKMKEMIKVCKDSGLLSKEHNSDYLTFDRIKANFVLGLDALNIAPQIAHMENSCIISNLNEYEKEELVIKCRASKQYSRWFGTSFNSDMDVLKSITALF